MTHIVMIGTDWSAFGGITAVIKSYKDGGLFDKWPIRFLATYQNDRLINKLLMALRAYIVLFFWLVTRQVAVVHAHSASRASFWRKSGLLCLALFFGVKTIFHLHSGEFPVFYHRECKPWQKRYIRWILRQVDQVIVLTSSWEETVLTIEPNCRVYALPNPIMASKFEATPIPFRVLFLGRLREKKGVYDLIASWKSIVDKYPLAQLVLAGDGDQNPFWDLAIELGIERQIEMPGWIAGGDKVLALRTADIFVLPSYFEGLPVCILEAMAQGVPVIASKVGGIPDICRDGIDGLLIEPGDVIGLSAAIDKLFADSTLRNRIIQSALGRINTEFVMEVVLADLGRIYSQLGAKPKSIQ